MCILCMRHNCRLCIGYLRNVARKASSVQALARWGLLLIHAFRESNDEVRSAVKICIQRSKTLCYLSPLSSSPFYMSQKSTWVFSEFLCSSLAKTFVAPSVEIPEKKVSSVSQPSTIAQVLLPVKTHFRKSFQASSQYHRSDLDLAL